VLDVVHAGMTNAQAVVVVMTAEDRAGLLPELAKTDADRADTQLQGQPRENVLFEAGMAIARGPKRTILVFVGDVRFPSDLAGRHVVRLDNSTRTRQDLRRRLETAGCLVKPTDDWLTHGALHEGDVKFVPPEPAATGT
jgi:predicted nucleotide-binding protein